MESEKAIIDWLDTFELPIKCTKLSDLKDGIILADALNEISPEHFDADTLNREAGDNWALAAGNLKILLRMLDNYFQSVCHSKVDMSDINMKEIAKTGESEQLLLLLELIVGAAFMCEDKIRFITNIMGLSASAQEVLKGLFEHFQSRQEELANDLEGEVDEEGFEEETFTNNNNNNSSHLNDEIDIKHKNLSSMDTPMQEAAVRSNEMIAHLQAERTRLLSEVSHLQSENSQVKLQLARLKDNASVKSVGERDEMVGDRDDRSSAAQMLESHNLKLSTELEQVKLDCDQKAIDNHNLQMELKAANARLESSKELQAKLEMENHQLSDELDVTRDKANKLIKAEQQIEKYAKKLEELVTLKKQNKEMSDKLDSYLDQIHDLESANKGLATMQKTVETYKNKAVELEREKFEAISSAQMKEYSLNQLQAEFDALVSSKEILEDELTNTKNSLEQLIEANEIEKGISRKARAHSLENKDGSDIFEVETVPSLKEKIKKLERELRAAATTSNEGGASSAEVTLLREELEDSQRIRKDREEALFAAKKQINELHSELTKASRSASDMEKHSTAAVALKETQQKLGETSNTVRLLEDKLKEKESVINKLEQEKNKLENYTKRSLATFKEKYMSVLQQMKEEKKELDFKIKANIEKSEQHHINWHREERLISSAMFEIGVRIMDRKIQANMNINNENASGGANTFMGHQREALKASSLEPGYAAGGVERKLFQGPNSPI